MSVNVRQATVDDVDDLVALSRCVQELHVAHRPDTFKDADSDYVAEWFNSKLQDPAVRAWIAESDGRPVGYVLAINHDRPENTFCFARRFCEIDQIGVLPAFRRKGIARLLVHQVLEYVQSEDITDVELTSWSFNSEAHDAFRALGFTDKVVRFERKNA